MFPFRKLPPPDEIADSGPPTMRSARLLAAAPANSVVDAAPLSEDGYMPILERSDIIQAVKPRETIQLSEADMELLDEDLELLFDEEIVLAEGEPDTERNMSFDHFDRAVVCDTDPPPPTLRCPTG